MTKPFDLLSLLAGFSRANGLALNDPELPERFVKHAQSGITSALADRTLLHGCRAERLFQAMVLTLNHYALFKVEDIGRVHGGQRPLRSPDFRIVLLDGEQWLVEVKNVYITKPGRQQTRLTASYMQSLRAYADLVGCPLRIAVYWARWGLWTVVSPDRFSASDGSFNVTMVEAIKANELAEPG